VVLVAVPYGTWSKGFERRLLHCNSLKGSVEHTKDTGGYVTISTLPRKRASPMKGNNRQDENNLLDNWSSLPIRARQMRNVRTSRISCGAQVTNQVTGRSARQRSSTCEIRRSLTEVMVVDTRTWTYQGDRRGSGTANDGRVADDVHRADDRASGPGASTESDIDRPGGHAERKGVHNDGLIQTK